MGSSQTQTLQDWYHSIGGMALDPELLNSFLQILLQNVDYSVDKVLQYKQVIGFASDSAQYGEE